jgi:hypothetical protein
MHYINNPNSPAKTYQQVMDAAINNGVDPKRVYIYLASLGVRGELARIFNGSQYDKPVKMAITGKNTLVTEVSVCGHCGSLVINNGLKQQPAELPKISTPKINVPTDPAFSNWLLLAAGEYKSAEYAYDVSGLDKAMKFSEFEKLFNKYYSKVEDNKFIRLTD